jgi:hypothetical protein
MFAFECPHCGHRIKTTPELAGRRGKCAACGKQIIVPSAETRSHAPAAVATIGIDGDAAAWRGDPISQLAVSDAPPRNTPSGNPLTPQLPLAQNLQACPDCSGLVSNLAAACPHCGRPILERTVKIERRYRALRILASLYRICGALIAVADAAIVVLFFDKVTSGQTEIAVPVFAIVLGLIFGAVTCFALAEAISVFLDIEENTRGSRMLQGNVRKA